VALYGHRHALAGDWILLLELVAPALLATYLGVKLTETLSAQQLRKIFGVFVILMGVFMVASNMAIIFNC
jgi:uncharacterized membrane protein YfcA